MPRYSFKWFLTAASFVTASILAQTVNAQATLINIGDLVSGEIAAPGEADTFEFDAIAGQVVFLDRTASNNPKGLYRKLQDRFCRVLVSNFGVLNDMGSVSLMCEAGTRSNRAGRYATTGGEQLNAD